MNELILFNALKKNLRDRDRLIVLHSSLPHFRLPWNQLKWPLLAALRRLVAEGRTLFLPTFTLSFCRGKPYHHLHSPSEVGILGQWFLELNEVRRSHHPIYSFAMAGPEAEKIRSLPCTTACGPDSPFGFFHRHNARFMLFGANPKDLTQLHHYEEEARVPYRYDKDFVGRVTFDDRTDDQFSARMYARYHTLVGKIDFSPAIRILRQRDLLREQEWHGGRISTVDCQALADVARELIRQDPFVFMSAGSAASARHTMEMHGEKEREPPLKVALLGNHNLFLLKTALEKTLSDHIQNRNISLYAPPFGQSYQEILDPNSDLHRFQADFVFFTDRLEDLFKTEILETINANDMQPLLHHLEMITALQKQASGTLFVNRFFQSGTPINGLAGQSAVRSLLDRANQHLDELIKPLDNIHIFDPLRDIHLYDEGRDPIHDARLWFSGRFPFSQGYSDHLARRYTGMVLAATGRTTRLLVVDLDNTMWGGILGEDGLEGLQLGGDYPGNAFLHFQNVLTQLMNRGIAIAIASKNDESHALEAINTLPDMRIREDQLATWRINWTEKWRNILEISQEVGLGLDNILFVDDNPVERQQVRLNLPAVKVLELPKDPCQYGRTLLRDPHLESIQQTREDLKRAKQYVAKRRLEQARQQFSDPDQFFSSLEPKLHIAPLTPTNTARAVQLVKKTNQFNTTTQRYTLNELNHLDAEGEGIFVLGLEDRFSEFENIGLAVVRWNHPREGEGWINLFLLSCRVLGRGVEKGFLTWLANHARTRGLSHLYGHIIPSKRNTPVRNLFEKQGFQPTKESGVWALTLKDPPPVPNWITIIDTIETTPHD